MLHDAAMSANFLVFIVPPWTLPLGLRMVGALIGTCSFAASFDWQEGQGGWMVVMRKSDLSVVHAMEIPAMSTFHFAGAYEEGVTGAGADGGATEAKLHVLVNRQIGMRADLEQNFKDMYKSTWTESAYNLLCDYTVDLASGELEASDPVLPRVAAAGSGSGGIGLGGNGIRGGQLPNDFPVIAPGARHRAPKYIYTVGFSGSGCG